MNLYELLYKIGRKIYINGKDTVNRKTKGLYIDKSAIVWGADFIINDADIGGSIKIGVSSQIYGELATMGYGGVIDIGDYSFVGNNTRIWAGKRIKIGNHVEISHNCNIFDNNTHPKNYRERQKQYYENMQGRYKGFDLCDSEIVIEDNVWIASGVSIVRGGLIIGENSIVGAGSVVVESIPRNSLAVGNPARVVKTLN